MRISTQTIYINGGATISDLQAQLVNTQEELSTGRRILTPADDPVASARVLELSQAQSANTQYGTNRTDAKDSLSQEESTLAGATDILQQVRTAIVNAGNGTYDDQQRKAIATSVSAQLTQLLGLANQRDGSGNYLFAGFQSSVVPFSQTATGAQYNGDQGQRSVQVGSTLNMAISDSGSSVFENNATGNGTFVTSAVATNTGTGVVSSGTVTNTAALTGDNYSLNFHVTAGVTTYDIVDNTLGSTLSAGNAYTSGQAISFDGLTLNVSGAPNDTDSFNVNPSAKQSVFTTIQNLVNVLNAPTTGALGTTNLTNGLNTASDNITNALDNLLTVRASVGSRLQQIDQLDSVGSDLNIQYQTTISSLQDVDYAKAISQLSLQQTTLQAAQQSFTKTTSLSLFNYIN